MTRRLVASGLALTVVVSTAATFLWIAGFTESTTPLAGSTILIGPQSPGSIVSVGPIPGVAAEVVDASRQAARVVYRSTDSSTGELNEVSGSVFLPRSEPPAGGWLVVAVDHEGAGVGQGCVPSAPLVAILLRRGYAVAVSDHQERAAGLAQREFLDAKTAGRNLIDAVRAIRGTFPGVSSRWAAFGTGEGGDAAWAANQQSDDYAAELDLVGAVALSPISDASALVDMAQNGTLNPAQRRTLLWSLASFARVHPDLDLDDYRHGLAEQRWDALTACSGALVKQGEQGNVATDDLDAFDLAPTSPEAADALRAFIRSYARTDEHLTAPLSVIYGEDAAASDRFQTTAAIGRGCAAGDTITWRLDRRAGQRNSRWSEQIDWLGDRFNGAPTANGCVSSSVSSDGAGSVISTEAIPAVAAELPPGSSAARVLYKSTDANTGGPTVVAGTVFTPPGMPPPGGWPVLGFAHGTTGIDEGCGPSLSPNLLSQAAIVARLLELNYAVAFTDYEGLGAPGVHRYLDSRTAGLNVIDSVRALRATFSDVSDRWVAFGHSQGGGAAWAADEQASTYAPELHLVGAVAMAPPANVTGMVDKAVLGTLTADQLPTFAAIVRSSVRADPMLDVESFRRGSAVANWEFLSTCDQTLSVQRGAAMTEVTSSELAPATPEAAAELRRLLTEWALPHRTLSAPLSVAYGSDDTYIDAQWTTEAVATACSWGDSLTVDLQRGRGHGDLDWTDQFTWISDRLASLAVTNTCPAVTQLR